jgi:tRNA modification GTPase
MIYDLKDTIAAIATSPGESGIGIVRLSGEMALSIANEIFLSADGKKPLGFATHTLHYGWIIRSAKPEKKDIVDEVILTVMRKPKSYTREDIVEINCHGGIVALRAVLDLVLAKGARLAQPGEFTKRAFLNGRIDLAQAEAVLDVIKAKTDSALRLGIEQLRGGLSQQLNQIRKVLLDQLALLEANIDFPEEEIAAADLEKVSNKLKQTVGKLKVILDGAGCGRIFREGINVVICGKPNVGKSSLLNVLLKEERSIVTPIAGTTRDTIEEVIDIKGIPLRIADTAGIIQPRDLIERKAIERTQRYIRLADLVILVFDGSKDLSREDELLMRKLKRKVVLAVINKMDLAQKIPKEKILKSFARAVEISAKKIKNIAVLEEEIANLVYKGKVCPSEAVLVSNRRHIELVKKVQKDVAEAVNSLDNKLSLEFITQGIKDALAGLDRAQGRSYSDDLLERIFSEFCIGK